MAERIKAQPKMKDQNDGSNQIPKWPLIVIVAAYLFTAYSWVILNPQFEGPDEHFHYFTAEQISQTWQLPSVPQPPFKFPFVATNDAEFLGQEAAQPPLYYMLTAPIIALFDTSQSKELTTFNPRAALGDASFPSNKNGFVHGWWERFPGQGHVAAVYAVRSLSPLFGLGTILCIFAAARLFWPLSPSRAWLAAGLVAALPQFTFQHSLISNDGLVTFLVSLGLFLLVRLELVGSNQYSVNGKRFKLEHYFWLGVVIGLSILTKNQGAVLLLFVTGVLMVRGVVVNGEWVATKNLQPIGRKILAVVVPALLIGGWLWVRNVRLYGDWSAANQFVAIAGGNREASLMQVLGESSGLWRSFIAVFGWMTVATPQWVYVVWVVVAFFALAGALFVTIKSLANISEVQNRHGHRPAGAIVLNLLSHPGVLLFGWVLLVYAALVAFMMQTVAAQGRLLFPAMLPIALAVAFGLSQNPMLGENDGQSEIGNILSLVLVLFGINLFALWAVVVPAFSPPEIKPAEAAQPLASWPSGIALVEVGQLSDTVVAGQWADVSLTWRLNHPIFAEDKPELVLEMFGANDELIGKYQGFHGRGLYPADLWSSTEFVQDVEHLHAFSITEDHQPSLPVLGRVFVKPRNEEPAFEAGTIKVVPTSWPQPATPENTLATFGQGIVLISAKVEPLSVLPGERVTVSVEWQVTADQSGDHTTYLHLLPADADGGPIATGDQKPRGGHYPTNIWQAGERFSDSYSFVVPEAAAGFYPLRLGMYDAASPTFDRLPVVLQGSGQVSDGILIAEFEIR